MNVNDMKESKYIAQKDVREPKTLTMSKLTQENVAGENKPEEMRWVLYFKEAAKGMVLNQTNAQLAAAIAGSEESDDWEGKTCELYVDSTIMYAGKVAGGVRMRPATNTPKAVESVKDPDEFNDDIPF